MVCLDAPSPPDYGGAIDMFHKIRALADSGNRIILHYFNYKKNRGHEGLDQYCSEIYTYPRQQFSVYNLNLPYIVGSRIHKRLIYRLNQDAHPIILEGLHTAGIIKYLNQRERVVIRMHNEEVGYYQQLAAAESNFVKRAYYQRESRSLKTFQQQLPKDIQLAVLSSTDLEIFKTNYGFSRVAMIPCFVGWQKLTGKIGKGSYCLYHGNLSVAENDAAARWLVSNVFSKINVPFIIAGKGISSHLKSESGKWPNITCVNNPDRNQLIGLIEDAHIHVLPSWNATGVKLKLLHAYFSGRFVITNTNGIAGSGLDGIIHSANTSDEFIEMITNIMNVSFDEAEIKKREPAVDFYNNAANAAKLNALL